MSKNEDFLVEIGCEELPPHELESLSHNFAHLLQQALKDQAIAFDAHKVQIFATPRRLAVLIGQMAFRQSDQVIAKRGPAYAAAFNPDGSPTKAAIGFAQSCGVHVEKLSIQETDKGKWLFFTQEKAGQKTIEVLPTIVEQVLNQLPIKKRMRWGAGDFAFVRPIHWILMLLGAHVVNARICGIETDNVTYGHRIHHPKPIKIDIAKIYADKLEQEGYVIADFGSRKEAILQEINTLSQLEKAHPVMDPELLTLVTGLVEFPVGLLATFDKDFLRVPKECLISAMQDHQKCFALLDNKGNLLPKFILISNLESTDPATVIRGNELVMQARLADAAFHYDKDLKKSLESRVPLLKNIVYQKQLGTLFDKVMRLQKLSQSIAPFIKTDVNQCLKAALLCKADLLTSMVYEFPELQGVMGYYYALHDKESQDVAIAIQEHYKPRSANDSLPASALGITLAIADRIDSLVGFFGIGLVPTGEKDPFALRRQALAIVRLLIEKDISLNLDEIFDRAIENYAPHPLNPEITQFRLKNDLKNFFNDRMKAWCLANNIQPQVYMAVENCLGQFYNPVDIYKRVNAVIEFQKKPEAINLTAANKRVSNLFKNLMDIDKIKLDINRQLLTIEEEKQLLQAIEIKEKEIDPLKRQSNYVAILQSLATLQKPIDNFFDKVMIMVDDQNLKENRLGLLKRLKNLFTNVADISLL